MELTPEDRRRIYEEEKARLEAQEELKAEDKRATSPPQSKRARGIGLPILGLLALLLVGTCYSLMPRGQGERQSSRSSEASSPTSPPSDAASKPTLFAKRTDNIRSGPGTEHPVLRKTSPGEELVYSEKRGSWYRLAGSSVERWIHESAVLTEQEKQLRKSATLALGDWSWRQEYGYAIAEGQITNVTSASLENVQAVVTFETSAGQFITSDDALVEYNPLLPGQTSPWKVMARWNPAMDKAHVGFKTLSGQTLSTYKQ